MTITNEASLPTAEQLEAERRRLRYKRRYNRTLRSTVAILIVAAALAVLAATLWMPVLRVYGSSMSPTLQNGQILVSVKSKSFSPGDIIAFYHGNKLLVKRYNRRACRLCQHRRRRYCQRKRPAARRAVSSRKGPWRDGYRASVSGS